MCQPIEIALTLTNKANAWLIANFDGHLNEIIFFPRSDILATVEKSFHQALHSKDDDRGFLAKLPQTPGYDKYLLRTRLLHELTREDVQKICQTSQITAALPSNQAQVKEATHTAKSATYLSTKRKRRLKRKQAKHTEMKLTDKEIDNDSYSPDLSFCIITPNGPPPLRYDTVTIRPLPRQKTAKRLSKKRRKKIRYKSEEQPSHTSHLVMVTNRLPSRKHNDRYTCSQCQLQDNDEIFMTDYKQDQLNIIPF